MWYTDEMNSQLLITNHIELRPNRDGQLRAFIVGTRIRVQDIVSDHERHGLTPEQIAREYSQLTLGQIHAALSFYFDHRDEILNDMRVDDDLVRSIESKHRQQGNGGKDAGHNPLSS
ncbi:MAG: DUF433 domain-containing protein [Planctomycetales bacterium]|nr:DUF433 domain-containing protein [Planctomycetales bacterium]